MAKLLSEHSCSSPCKQGWGGVKNGELLKLAEDKFDLFITSDQNLRYQQNLSGRKIAILELSTNDWHAIRVDEHRVRLAVGIICPGDFIHHVVPALRRS